MLSANNQAKDNDSIRPSAPLSRGLLTATLVSHAAYEQDKPCLTEMRLWENIAFNPKENDHYIFSLEGRAKLGLAHTINLLTEYRDNPNTADGNGRNRLHLAIISGDFNKAKLLIEYGAVLKADRFKETALHAAIRSKNRRLLTLLLQTYEQEKLVTFQEAFDAIISKQTDQIYLAIAVHLGYWGLVEELVLQGANVYVTNKKGESYLHEAIRHKEYSTALLFLMAGCEVNVTNNDQESALHSLISLSCNLDQLQWAREIIGPTAELCSAINLLIAYGINLEATDKDGYTPLGRALSCWFQAVQGDGLYVETYEAVVRTLIAAGATLDENIKLPKHCSFERILSTFHYSTALVDTFTAYGIEKRKIPQTLHLLKLLSSKDNYLYYYKKLFQPGVHDYFKFMCFCTFFPEMFVTRSLDAFSKTPEAKAEDPGPKALAYLWKALTIFRWQAFAAHTRVLTPLSFDAINHKVAALPPELIIEIAQLLMPCYTPTAGHLTDMAPALKDNSLQSITLRQQLRKTVQSEAMLCPYYNQYQQLRY